MGKQVWNWEKFFNGVQETVKPSRDELQEKKKEAEAYIERLQLLRGTFLAIEEELVGLMDACLSFIEKSYEAYPYVPVEQTRMRYSTICIPVDHFVEGMYVIADGDPTGKYDRVAPCVRIECEIIKVKKESHPSGQPSIAAYSSYPSAPTTPATAATRSTPGTHGTPGATQGMHLHAASTDALMLLVTGTIVSVDPPQTIVEPFEIPASCVLFTRVPILQFVKSRQWRPAVTPVAAASVDYFGSSLGTDVLVNTLTYCLSSAACSTLTRLAARRVLALQSSDSLLHKEIEDINDRYESLAGRCTILLLGCLPTMMRGAHGHDAYIQTGLVVSSLDASGGGVLCGGGSAGGAVGGGVLVAGGRRLPTAAASAYDNEFIQSQDWQYFAEKSAEYLRVMQSRHAIQNPLIVPGSDTKTTPVKGGTRYTVLLLLPLLLSLLLLLPPNASSHLISSHFILPSSIGCEQFI